MEGGQDQSRSMEHSGEIEPADRWWLLVLASFVAYPLASMTMGAGGILLLRDLFKASQSPTGSLYTHKSRSDSPTCFSQSAALFPISDQQ